MFCCLLSFTFPPGMIQSVCSACSGKGGWQWWTSAVFQIVIQLLKTSSPVLPCITKCGGGAVQPLLAPFLKCWYILRKYSPTLKVGTAFACCFWEWLWSGAEEGLEGMVNSCLGPSYMALWPRGKKKGYRSSQGEWPCGCEHFLFDLEYDPKVCSEVCLL